MTELTSHPDGEAEVVRVAAADISFAWQQVLQGSLVDISPALSSPEGGEVSDEDYEDFIAEVQEIFDGIAQTVNSPEYAVIAGGVRETLKEVKGQHFIFDLEGVVLADVKDSSTDQIVYYPLPWMMPLIRTLMENGNTVVFWTSATKQYLTEMRRCMSPALAAIPALSRDDFETVLVSYQSYQQELLTLESVLGIMKEAYPLGDEEAFKAGLPVIDEALLTAYKQDHERLLRETKLPQLFISPDSGFFVDDNLDFINSATSRGWPEHRAIHCPPAPHDSQILAVAQAIRSGFPDESTN